ncbi:hypothetical protein VTG60DRAFT_78 [Thermothelomyces hinnuleus]
MAPLDALTFVLALVPLVACQFYTPLPSREVYHVGEIKTIKYHTELTNYTIVLWQQSMAGGSADPGPIVFRATEGELMPSAYFYITDAPLPKSQSSPTTTSSSLSSSTTTSSSSADSSSSFSSSLPSSDTTSSSLQTELPTMLPPESSVSSSTGTDSSSTSAATQDQEETATGGAGSESSGGEGGKDGGGEGGGGGGDLPVAAQVGIGVGVSIFGLTVIVCGILWFRYLRKQQKVLAELQQRVSSQPPDAAAMWKMQQYPFELAVPEHYLRTELSGSPGPPRAELS